MLSYLPLAHMMERSTYWTAMVYGCTVNIYRGDTLKLVDDIKLAKPTIFISVPRLYNRIYGTI